MEWEYSSEGKEQRQAGQALMWQADNKFSYFRAKSSQPAKHSTAGSFISRSLVQRKSSDLAWEMPFHTVTLVSRRVGFRLDGASSWRSALYFWRWIVLQCLPCLLLVPKELNQAWTSHLFWLLNKLQCFVMYTAYDNRDFRPDWLFSKLMWAAEAASVLSPSRKSRTLTHQYHPASHLKNHSKQVWVFFLNGMTIPRVSWQGYRHS